MKELEVIHILTIGKTKSFLSSHSTKEGAEEALFQNLLEDDEEDVNVGNGWYNIETINKEDRRWNRAANALDL